MANSSVTLILIALAALCVGAALTLLTPLRWIMLIEPSITDVDPVAFHQRLTADPDRFVFLDVRPEAAYSAIHAEGSRNMPLHTFYDAWRTLPRTGQEIVLICSGGRASGVAYHFLKHFGFFNVSRIEGGIEAWVMAGLPTGGTSSSINSTAETP